MLTMRTRIFLTTALTVLGTSASGLALAKAKTTHTYSSTLQSAPLSTANGYPNPGGTAHLAGAVKIRAYGVGALIDDVTITGHPASNVFTYRGSEVDFFDHGTWRSTLTGTATVQSDGSQRIAVTGRFTGGTGRYVGARGRYTFSGTVPAGSSVLTGRSTGSITY